MTTLQDSESREQNVVGVKNAPEGRTKLDTDTTKTDRTKEEDAKVTDQSKDRFSDDGTSLTWR